MTAEWGFLVDENLDPQIAHYLENEGVRAEHVLDALFEGADDRDDLLPYARAEDLVVVTNDVTDFSRVPDHEHEGVVIVYDGALPAFDVAAGLLAMMDAYPDRDALRGYEVLDDWV